MAKVHKNPAAESASVGPKISLGIVSFYSDKTPAKHNFHPGLAEITEYAGVDLKEQLRRSREAGNLYTLVAFTQGSNYNFAEPALKKICHRQNPEDVFLLTSADKNELKLELISGFKTNELHAPAVFIRTAILSDEVLSSLNTNDKAEFLYGLEKVSSTWCNENTDHTDKSLKINPGLKARLAWAWNWYKPGNSFQKPWKLTFFLASIAALVAVTMMSRDAGISGDEFTQYDWADTAIIPYYTDGKDAALSDPAKNMHLYGSSFDTFTAVVARITGTDDIYEMRHFWNAVFGFICIFFTSLIIKRITGSYLYALLGLVILFFTPRIIGDALNNPKDIPFAAGYVIALYYSLKYFSAGGRRPTSQLIGIIMGVSLAISIRIGGLVLLPIIVAVAGFEYIRQIGWKSFLAFKWTGFKSLLLQFIILTVSSYFLGILFWPYGIEDPFVNPFDALEAFTNYEVSLRQLFEGKLFDSDLLPGYYLVKYIFITLPVVSILGLGIFAAIAISKLKSIPPAVWYVVFAGVFPVAYIWIQNSNVYGGLRQVLFVIPCLIAAAVYGYYLLSKKFGNKAWMGYATASLMLILTIPPANHVIKSHPMEYVYFNEFVGGVEGAYGNYEMDYYLASLKPSTEWFLENVARKNPGKKYTVLTYGMDQVKYYCRKDTNVHVGFTRYDDRSEKKWDYAIFFNAYMDKARLLGETYPPVGTVFSPKINGKPMGVVIQRPGFEDYEGFNADRNKDYNTAVLKYKQYLKKDPNSNEVYLYLAYAYANLNNLDSAIWAAGQSVKLYPEFTKALFALNQFYVGKKDYDNAIKVMDKYLESRPKDGDAYLIKGQTLAQKGDLNGAIQSIQSAISSSPMDYRSYQLGAQIYQALGDNLNASLYNDALLMFSSKDAAQNEKGQEAVKGIYLSITGKELDMEKYK